MLGDWKLPLSVTPSELKRLSTKKAKSMRGDCIGHNEGINLSDEEELMLSRLAKLKLDTVVEKPTPEGIPYKYNEDVILKEIAQYVDKTYKGHYVGDDNVQSLDLILATGHATGFNIGNMLKYGSRYGKKNGFNRDDLLKVIHYAMFELYNHSKHHMDEIK